MNQTQITPPPCKTGTGHVMGLKSLGAYVTYQLGKKKKFWGIDLVMDAYPGILDVSFLLFFFTSLPLQKMNDVNFLFFLVRKTCKG
jgi:hypothetical protein